MPKFSFHSQQVGVQYGAVLYSIQYTDVDSRHWEVHENVYPLLIIDVDDVGFAWFSMVFPCFESKRPLKCSIELH